MADTGSDLEEPVILGGLLLGVGLLVLLASQSEVGQLLGRGRHRA